VQGPSLIFDKSALQCLSFDEAIWLDNFYRCNITPLFYIETLGDLEKQVASGRAPEEVVGEIAYKSPDWQSVANVHHMSVLWGELSGRVDVDFTMGRPAIGGGQTIVLNGQAGMLFQPSKEDEALRRWQNREFLDIERQIAKGWRRGLSRINPQEYATVINRLADRRKLGGFAEAKALADEIIDLWEQQFVLVLGLSLVGVPGDYRTEIAEQWVARGKPPLREAFPYFCHVLSIDFTFYFATAAKLVRNAAKPSNMVDIAYLYYLPFCCVFASGDRLHRNLAPLFMRPFQKFLTSDQLKQELKQLNEYYSALPDEVLNTGLINFASTPPNDLSFLTTQLWDQYLPKWRGDPGYRKNELSPGMQKALVEMLNRWDKEGKPADPSVNLSSDEVAQLTIKKKISLRKGQWRRFSPEMETAIVEDEKQHDS
jgi:hypothetical protein